MKTFEFVVNDIIQETPNTRSYYLLPTSTQSIKYEAGQFLTLEINRNDRIVRRSYSISSTPGIDPIISITIQQIANGEISRHLFNELRKGSIIRALEPAGRFILETNKAFQRTIFFVAAGSGITPVFSLLKKVLYTEPLSKVVLLYQNKDKAHTIFYQALMDLEEKFSSRFNLIFLFSKPSDGGTIQRLNMDLLESLVLQYHPEEKEKAIFFTCGPKAFMRMVEYAVKTAGYESEQIRKEFFLVDPIPAPPPPIDSSQKKAVIHFNGQEYNITVRYPQTILQAALEQSLLLPYSCRGGRCSTCVARCTKGKVMMSINEILTDKDLANGLVLPCVGYAMSDVELKYEVSSDESI
jgi:ring-1,2-phenylacetyl-CoA epoxidase subunit PaaE